GREHDARPRTRSARTRDRARALLRARDAGNAPVGLDPHSPTLRRVPRPAPVPGGASPSVHGLQVNEPPPAEIGSVHSGPRFVTASGRVTNASGPALCSPLNGVEPVKPQSDASAGLLNQNPRWNVLVCVSDTSLSTPKIWSSSTVRMR